MAALHWRAKCFGYLLVLALKWSILESPIKYFCPKWQEIEIPDGQVLIKNSHFRAKNSKDPDILVSSVYVSIGKLHIS